jgi:DNA-binding GntR family transcriptional regulator
MRKKVSPGQPAYVQIAADLRSQIENGDLPPGARLPTFRELSSEWSVSEIVARQALTTLKADGLVHGMQGKGTFVSEGRLATAFAAAPDQRHITAVQALAQGLADGSVSDAALPFVATVLASAMAELANRMAATRDDDDDAVEE